MGRKTQVTREQLLEAGLRLLIREGYSAVSVKSVAAECGCSTSPIAWGFDNIDNYRRELHIYAKQYLDKKMLGDGTSATADHRKTGSVYVDTAIDEPNLIRYLRTNEEELQASGGIGFLFDKKKNSKAAEGWAKMFGIPKDDAVTFMQFITTYTEGVVSLILSGVIHPTKDEAHKMLDGAAGAYMTYLKTNEMRSLHGDDEMGRKIPGGEE